MIYIWGDNGSSAEGQAGTISELLAQNQIANTVAQQIDALNKIGGFDALGGPKTGQYVSCRLGVGRRYAVPLHQADRSHFGGTRNPMAISWPAGIKPDKTPRAIPSRQ